MAEYEGTIVSGTDYRVRKLQQQLRGLEEAIAALKMELEAFKAAAHLALIPPETGFSTPTPTTILSKPTVKTRATKPKPTRKPAGRKRKPA